VVNPVVRQFWRTFFGLALISTLFTAVSWWYLVSSDVVLTEPVTKSQVLSLPTSIPSIWNVIRPSTNITWFAPFVVLVAQVFLTGGFYGSLVRANTGQPTNPATFLHDAIRSFWRLFLWYLLWTGLNILLAGVVRVFPQSNATATALVLLLRYLFLFSDVALVSERNVSFALRSAVGALLSGLVTMLPYGVLLVIVTSAAMSLSTSVSWLTLLGVAVLYGVVASWLLHMVVARYLFFTNWAVRSGAKMEA
jgi:hypothetical protein